jgi:hypothetical protein
MDGVIADFNTQAQNHNVLLPDGELINDGHHLDYDWWVSIPAYPGARAFYDQLTAIAPVRFLTGPKPNPGCHAGKAQWIKDFVPERGPGIVKELIICPKRDKWLLAAPGRILIDDREASIKSWRQAGGIGVLHKGDFAATLAEVKNAVAILRAPAAPKPSFPPAGPAP